MDKKALIISYAFPPYPGIGGRRWAKFAHYLAKRGYSVYVLCAQNPFNEVSQWNEDVQHSPIKVRHLPVKYPHVLLVGATDFAGKITYHICKAFLTLRSKGVALERTIFWKPQLLKHASRLIKEYDIKNLIITIPPYRLAYYASFLKKKFPEINLLIDYRDPWTDNKSFHGFKNISPQRLKHEQYMEQEALKAANYVLTVSEVMTSNLKLRSTFPERVKTLYNGFDPTEINLMPASTDAKRNTYNFVYAGTIYSNLDYIIEPLLAYVNYLKNNRPDIYNKTYFEFYGNCNAEMENKIKQFADAHFLLHGYIPLKAVQQKLQQASFGVLISAPDHAFAFNTKFFEYLANRKPVLLFSYAGPTADFLNKNKLGFHINPDTIRQDMDTFFANIDSIMAGFNSSFDISRFSLPALTSELENFLK